jgi:hypothetical protein
MKLVERDLQQGLHFRNFLKKLVKANMLNLIPQCHAMPRSGGKYDWTFNRASDRMPVRKAAAPAADVAVPSKEETAEVEEAKTA